MVDKEERKTAVEKMFEENKDFAIAHIRDVAERLCMKEFANGKGIYDVLYELHHYIEWAIRSDHFNFNNSRDAYEDPKVQEVTAIVKEKAHKHLDEEFDFLIQSFSNGLQSRSDIEKERKRQKRR